MFMKYIKPKIYIPAKLKLISSLFTRILNTIISSFYNAYKTRRLFYL